MKTNIILNGDALIHLRKFPENSINMVMTSPPYWALRDYGFTVETVWGGEEDCEHEFKKNEEIVRFSNNKWKKGNEIIEEKDLHEYKTRGDSFCSKCNAWKGQLGLEPTFDLYIKHLCDIFDEVKRVLRNDGTIWINIGDTYASSPAGSKGNQEGTDGVYGRLWDRHTQGGTSEVTPKPKDYGNLSQKSLVMIPFRFAIEMVNRGWILRNTIIWHKRNCMPSSVKDRFTVDFEYLFFFSKKKKYYFETQYEPLKTSSIKRLSQNIENQKGLQRGTDGISGKRNVKAVASKISPYNDRPSSPHYRK